ncbi:MAG: antibiotic biosynthesis monooxygenase [Deltaproteobacteria bacterium]|nr:antibiotic biosynthesis monooxygenase [Deltaproteobacteria bacterium]
MVSEAKEKDILPLVLDLKKLGKAQPGFISEEIWRHLEKRDEYLVVRSWDSEDDWYQWLANPQRISIQGKIESQLGRKTEYSPYELVRRTEKPAKSPLYT